MVTLNLDWREVLWWMQGGMAGSHLRWNVYEDMVNKVWPQCSEQERRNMWFVMRRDLGYCWRPDGWSGFDMATAHGEGEWKPAAAVLTYSDDPTYDPAKCITDLTPWNYFRQVLTRFDPENQFAVTMDCTVEQESPFGDGDALFSQMMHDKAVQQATVMARAAMNMGILMPDNLIDRQQIEAERPSVTVRTYKWKDLNGNDAYFINWCRRCDPDKITKTEKMDIPDDGTM